jgi:hypothetical protein
MAGLARSRRREPIDEETGTRSESVAASTTRPGSRARNGSHDGIRGLVAGLRRWLERWSAPARMETAGDSPERTHLTPPSDSGRPSRVVFVVTFGLCGAELDRALELTLGEQQTDDIVPVFLTDASDFEAFRRRGAIFEHWPAPPALPSVAEAWRDFERRRLQLLQAKWRPVRVIALGSGSATRLDEIRGRPTPGA